MDDQEAESKTKQTSFHDIRSKVEAKVDDLIFKTFKSKVYDSKDC